MKVRTSLITILLFSLLVGHARAETLRSPPRSPNGDYGYQRTSIKSPDGLYIVTHMTYGIGDYRLSLLDRKRDRKLSLYRHQRYAELQWSPDSRHIALSDFMLSNEADLYVVRLPNVSFTSPDARIYKFIHGEELLGGSPDHIYYAAERWMAPEVLIVRVWADRSEAGTSANNHNFIARVRYSLATGRLKLLSLQRDLPRN